MNKFRYMRVNSLAYICSEEIHDISYFEDKFKKIIGNIKPIYKGVSNCV
jgi:hypothetical protein